MTLGTFIQLQKQLVSANFPFRNSVAITGNPARIKRTKSMNRKTIRKAIHNIRLAQFPETSAIVAERVQWMVS